MMGEVFAPSHLCLHLGTVCRESFWEQDLVQHLTPDVAAHHPHMHILHTWRAPDA